jgi:hypothetical protein
MGWEIVSENSDHPAVETAYGTRRSASRSEASDPDLPLASRLRWEASACAKYGLMGILAHSSKSYEFA